MEPSRGVDPQPIQHANPHDVHKHQKNHGSKHSLETPSKRYGKGGESRHEENVHLYGVAGLDDLYRKVLTSDGVTKDGDPRLKERNRSPDHFGVQGEIGMNTC